MATQWGQTNLRHTDINVQREFERKSSPVVQSKTQSSVGGSNPSAGGITQSSENQYTVYHNGTPVNTLGMNQSINFTDVTPATDDMTQVSFTLRALGDNGKEDAIIAAFVPKEPWYIERFTLEVLDIEAAQNIEHNGYKYRNPMYHDVYHGLNNPVYSIYCVGHEHAVPEVEMLIDRLRVRCRVSDNYDIPRPFLNTTWNFSADVSENISKFDNLEFVIIVRGTLDERANIA